MFFADCVYSMINLIFELVWNHDISRMYNKEEVCAVFGLKCSD